MPQLYCSTHLCRVYQRCQACVTLLHSTFWLLSWAGQKTFFHFTFPSDKYCADFGCPNIKSTCPEKIKHCQIRFRRCDPYYILCKLLTPDLTKQKKEYCSRKILLVRLDELLYEFQSSKAKRVKEWDFLPWWETVFQEVGRLRYLKRCLWAFPFSCPAIFHSFTISLLAHFFRSSALTKTWHSLTVILLL